MRVAPLLCALLLAASTAWADADVPVIRLGEAPPAPPAADPAKVKAVERFLADRQDASANRILASALRRDLALKRQVDDELLVGPRGATLLAFDFEDADVPLRGERVSRFSLPVHLLFARSDGQVVETRTERLTFVASGAGWKCADIVPTNVVTWDDSESLDAAKAAGIGAEIDQLKARLRSASRRDQRTAYSLTDVDSAPDGRVIVRCLRYTAEPGRRGFDIDDRPVVLVKQDGSYRIDTN
ncbi:MAG: hypothetical protein ACM3JJ_08350 [Hyphomicrobiales bacterium]